MKTFPSYLLLSLLIPLFFLTGCRDKLSTEPHPYVLAYTSGQISVNSPIIIKFSDDAPFLKEFNTGDEVPSGILKFSPGIKGKALWSDSRTIQFIADKPLQYGKDYRITVNMAKIMKTGDTPKKFVFEVVTFKPSYTVYNDGLSMYGENEHDIFYLKGVISTNGYVANEDAEKMLDLKSPENLNITWSHDAFGTTHTFTIDSIRSKDNDYEISLKYNGKSFGNDVVKDEVVNIPEKGAFRLLDVVVEYSPEFRTVVTFSSAIADRQRLGDFFQFSRDLNCSYASNLNKVYIYPEGRIIGKYQLTVNEGLLNVLGKKLESTTTSTIEFEEIDPTVKFIGKGSVMTSSSNLKMPFRSINYGEVEVKVIRIFQTNILQFLQENELDGDYEIYRVGREVADTTIKLGDIKSERLRNWNTYSLDIGSLINAEPGAIYRIMIRGKVPLIEKENSDDNNNDGDYEGDYEGGYDNDYSFGGDYSTRKDRIRNILASDLGIIAKVDDTKKINVYVTNLITAAPESGASVKVYDFVNQLIGQGTSDGEGMVKIALTREAQVVVVEKNKQWGYLKVNSGTNLTVSEFDVSGQAVHGGLKGYIYGERGVWRPGDEIFLSFILMDRDKLLPKGHPINLTLRDPNGQIVTSQTKTQVDNSIYTFKLQTNPEAITGIYTAYINVGNSQFTKSLRIETVKPNRLKIDFTLNDTPVLDLSNVKGTIASQWLTGARTQGLDTKVELALSKADTKFAGYEQYEFTDRTKSFKLDESEIFAGRLDENGSTSFTKSINDVSSAPGMLNAKFTVRVFENSGDFSIDQYTTRATAFPTFVGIRAPKSDNQYWDMLATDKNHTFSIATLTPDGKATNCRSLRVEIFRTEWSWWWNSSDDGYANYNSGNANRPVYTTTLSSSGGKTSFDYKWDRSDWGTYMIKVTDLDGGHSSTLQCYVDWADGGHDRGDSEASGATMLSIKSDKPLYKVGEKAKITFPSAAGARALLTIESGSTVLNSRWYDLKPGSTTIDIDVTHEMAPNVYAYITLVQPHSRTLNDAPMRLYGVIPLMVEDGATRLYPVINVPSVLRPETQFTVKVSEKTGRAMNYTIAIVDDGLLGLTRFKTPNAWDSFYAREALGVRTWDIYDNVIGAYAGRIEQLFAIGGDGEIIAKGDTKAQRFKPVVKFLGPFTLAKGKVAEHTIKLPPYIGSVRTMVVASSNEIAYGSAEAQSIVRKPLMIVTTMPRVISTDEEIEVPVTVFAMEKTVKDVTLKITEATGFTVVGNSTQSVSFSDAGDKIVFFRLKAKSAIGIGKLTVLAKCSNDSATETIEIDIRDPNPKNITSLMEIVEKGANYSGKLALAGVKGTNSCALEVSSIPPLNLSRRLQFLINYPHGCLEQTTSSVFPQLYLNTVADLDAKMSLKTETNIKAAILRYNNFRTSSGELTYWPGGNYVNPWANTYAGHFLLEARRLGYSIPADLISNWLGAEKKAAQNWTISYGNPESQAYRLYVLALGKSPELGAMNRLKENTTLTPIASWMLAGAYALNGKSDVANKIISNLKLDTPTSQWNRDNFGDSDRDMGVIVSVLNSMKLEKQAFPIAMKLSESLSSSKWMSTQSCSWALLALSNYAYKNDANTKFSFDYNIAGVKGSDKLVKATKSIPISVTDKSGEIPVSFTNTGTNRLYARISSEGIPEKGKEVSRSENLSITVAYKTMDGTPLDITNLKLGTDFMVDVVIRNTGSTGYYQNLVLTHIFPSGWEIRDSKALSGNLNFKDIRDDRVYSYFGLSSSGSITIRTRLTATYVGKFYLPGTFCEAMYDGSIYASTVGQWCSVVR